MIIKGNKERVYISGPITGVEGFLEKFAEAEAMLTAQGKYVVNPAKVNSQLPEGIEYEEFMTICMDLLAMCDSVYMLKGWQKSRGANREYGYALGKGMKIYEEE